MLACHSSPDPSRRCERTVNGADSWPCARLMIIINTGYISPNLRTNLSDRLSCRRSTAAGNARQKLQFFCAGNEEILPQNMIVANRAICRLKRSYSTTLGVITTNTINFYVSGDTTNGFAWFSRLTMYASLSKRMNVCAFFIELFIKHNKLVTLSKGERAECRAVVSRLLFTLIATLITRSVVCLFFMTLPASGPHLHAIN